MMVQHPILHTANPAGPARIPSAEPAPVHKFEVGSTSYIVDKIMDRRKVGRDYEFFVKWQGYDETYNTWEP